MTECIHVRRHPCYCWWYGVIAREWWPNCCFDNLCKEELISPHLRKSCILKSQFLQLLHKTVFSSTLLTWNQLFAVYLSADVPAYHPHLNLEIHNRPWNMNNSDRLPYFLQLLEKEISNSFFYIVVWIVVEIFIWTKNSAFVLNYPNEHCFMLPGLKISFEFYQFTRQLFLTSYWKYIWYVVKTFRIVGSFDPPAVCKCGRLETLTRRRWWLQTIENLATTDLFSVGHVEATPQRTIGEATVRGRWSGRRRWSPWTTRGRRRRTVMTICRWHSSQERVCFNLSFDKIYHQVVEEHLAPALNDSNPLNLPPRLQVSLMQANRCDKDSTFILWTVYK